MKFSEKMCLKIIIKVRKNQGFTLSLEDIFSETPPGGRGQITPPPTPPAAVLDLLMRFYFLNRLEESI